MRKQTGLVLAAALGALLIGGAAAGIAQANQGSMHGSHEDRFKAMDTDGNGKISAAEFEAVGITRFTDADLNHDGKVTYDEMKEAREKRREAREQAFFKSLDTNGDGALTEAELKARPDTMFAKLDANKDGFLSADELKAGHGKWRRHHGDDKSDVN